MTGILLAHPGAFGSGELKISVFRVTGLKILGRIGDTHFFPKKMGAGGRGGGGAYNFMHFVRHFAFQNV